MAETSQSEVLKAEGRTRARGLGVEMQDEATEIVLRAELRAGEVLAGMEKQSPGDYKRSQAATVQPSLSDLGISKTQSSRWQRMWRGVWYG